MRGSGSRDSVCAAERHVIHPVNPTAQNGPRPVSILRRTALSASTADTRGIVGQSGLLLRAVADTDLYARVEDPVIIQGETGVGKSLFARRLHERSGRAGALITVAGGELADGLYQSQLYGHRRGAFTGAVGDSRGLFEAAAGGSLFVDELHLTSLSIQGALLRALQERRWTPVGTVREQELTCRFIFACQRPLDELVREGLLLPDLRWRLGEAVVRVPALFQRLEDVPLLADHFLRCRVAELSGAFAVVPERLSASVMAAMLGREWPGNVRELEGVVREAVLRAAGREGRVVELEDLPGRLGPGGPRPLGPERRRIVVGWATAHRAITRAELAHSLGVSTATVDVDRRWWKKCRSGELGRSRPSCRLAAPLSSDL